LIAQWDLNKDAAYILQCITHLATRVRIKVLAPEIPNRFVHPSWKANQRDTLSSGECRKGASFTA
jgi:hypothetical protein